MLPPPSSPPKAATLHDVAREARVSLITASRALSNPTLVSGKTIERVRSAVAAIGRLAAQMIIDRCAGKTIAQPIVDAGFHIVERQSTAAA